MISWHIFVNQHSSIDLAAGDFDQNNFYSEIIKTALHSDLVYT